MALGGSPSVPMISTAHLLLTKAQAGFLIFAATAAVPLSLLDAISVGELMLAVGNLDRKSTRCR